MMNGPQKIRSLIGGEWVNGDGGDVRSLDPADPDGAAVAAYRAVTEEQIDAAVGAAVAAAREWDQVGVLARGTILRRAADILDDRADEVAQLMTREHGKTLTDSRIEVAGTVETLHYHSAASRRPNGATYPATHPEEVVRTLRRPVGVVGIITPWNFPIMIPAWKIAPALLWGNTVVWKPASDTPACAAVFAEILHEAGVPSGVLNLVLAPGSLGSHLVGNSAIDAVSFTGSVPVGEQIRATVTGRGARLQMELGGHNPALVFPDADVENAAELIVAASVNSTGQKCTAVRRIIAVGNSYEPLREALVRRFTALRVGPGTDSESELGPVINARAAEEITSAIDQAVAEGAEVIAQAPIPTTVGCWVPPTLLEGSTDQAIARQEVFGPVPLLMRADDLDDAIGLANDTEFGLTASVFTDDERIVRRCLADLTAGLIKVNGPNTGSEIHAPFGGLAASSFPAPREQASDSAAEFFSITKAAYQRLSPVT
ncbi:aldehyde dehydrogenase family protein [Brevibacterium casei]|uniref:Aldehyde dehydrogenase, thermostable n=3 Tax=Brevibacterium TaxID=1696 RepID=A0A449D8J4_9MICO|nr:aldehyde dehydrogenase family protein [Brevibacterium casei]MCT2181513.1 aldehyde dehydrogenase family protein [Brevibacterium casei]MDH5147682.1 aldehyde dehydrogenase family protein [Brevibacterium casei]QZE25240.1 aldehyde dehydrogenase family protein [Brevibacterium casei]VEW13882.1 Aldehyde dehydrogenase, thermostable [Brevibacterium casei]